MIWCVGPQRPECTYRQGNSVAKHKHKRITPIPGDAREDWTIIRALSSVLGNPLGYNDLNEIRGKLVDVNPVFLSLGEIIPAKWGEFGEQNLPSKSTNLRPPIDNFYMTDPISRASVTMSQCMEMFSDSIQDKTGTDG